MNIQSILHTMMAKRNKTEKEKAQLLAIIDFAKDVGIKEFLSNADIQLLESAVKFLI